MPELPRIRMLPIASIAVLNPRERNKKLFKELVSSIERVGLKKPITVSNSKIGSGYDLVCGQGRLEAFVALKQSEIPAIVIDVSEQDCFVMSLVENLARRHPGSLELLSEIGALRTRGYSHNQIADKIGFSVEHVTAVCYLLDHGEERLLLAVEKGKMPHTVAMEIARAHDGDVQKALAEAYEMGVIPGNQVLGIRRIVEQRNTFGKSVHTIRAQKSCAPKDNGRRIGAKLSTRSRTPAFDRKEGSACTSSTVVFDQGVSNTSEG